MDVGGTNGKDGSPWVSLEGGIMTVVMGAAVIMFPDPKGVLSSVLVGDGAFDLVRKLMSVIVVVGEVGLTICLDSKFTAFSVCPCESGRSISSA